MTQLVPFPSIRPRSAELVLPFFAYGESGFRDTVYQGMVLGSKAGEARLSLLFENEQDDLAAMVDECYSNTVSGVLPVLLPQEIAAGVADNDFKKRFLLENHLRWYFSGPSRISSVLGGAEISTFSVELVASFNFADIIDIIPPVAPTFGLASDTGYSNSDGITQNGQVTVFGVEDSATWEYSVNAGATWQVGTLPGFALTPGTYPGGYIKVRQKDRAGNLSPELSNQSTIVVDITPPFITEIKVQSSVGAQAGILNEGDQIRIIATMNEPVIVSGSLVMKVLIGSTLREVAYDEVTSTSSVLSFVYTVQNGDIDLNGVAIPENSIQAVIAQAGAGVFDFAGNSAILSHAAVPDNPEFIVDTNAPAQPSFSLAVDTGVIDSDWITSNGLVNVFGVSVENTWHWSVDSGATWTTGVGASFVLSAGVYQIGSIRVRQMNPAGTLSPQAQNALLVTVDQVAPIAAAVVAGPSTAGVSVTAEFNSVVTLVFSRVGGGSVSRQISGNGGSPVVVTLTLAEQVQIGEGTVSVVASISDLAGNQGPDYTMSFQMQYTGDTGFQYPSFSSTNGLNLVDVDGVVNNAIVLTNTVKETTTGSVGNVWNATARRYDKDWSMYWRMEIAGPSSPGADGFTVQWDTVSTRLGLRGYDCGRVSGTLPPWQFTFNTYTYNRIRVVKFGVQQLQVNSSFNARQDLHYWLDYFVSTSTIRLYVGTTPTKPTTHAHQFTGVTFPASNYHVGIGAATGSITDNHILKAWSLSIV